MKQHPVRSNLPHHLVTIALAINMSIDKYPQGTDERPALIWMAMNMANALAIMNPEIDCEQFKAISYGRYVIKEG